MTTDDGYRIDYDQHSILELLAMRRTTVGARAPDTRGRGVLAGRGCVRRGHVTAPNTRCCAIR